MATTYLTLVNNVLNELNEPELTSSTFSSSRGIQTSVKKFVLKAMHEVYNSLSEVPDLYLSTTQDTYAGQRTYDLPSSASPQSTDKAYRKIDWDTFRLVPKELVTNGEFTSNITGWTTGDGTPSHSTSGNGRLNLNDAAAYQSISTVKNKTYRLQVRVMSPSSSTSTVAIKVGTTASGGEYLSTTQSVTNIGDGATLDTTFDATAQTSYIYFETASGVQLDIDYVRISENIGIKKLKYITYDDWQNRYLETDLSNTSSSQGTPDYVYHTQDKKFGLSPVPNQDTYTIQYEYWQVHTDLSAHGDTMDLDDRFKDVIITKAKYYAYVLRSDPQAAAMSVKEYDNQLQQLRSEYINTKTYMRDTRVN
tara:strand:+ start:920 stop:2011 length:1092 start_codon:yes stop_codon:yes gene_type:complete